MKSQGHQPCSKCWLTSKFLNHACCCADNGLLGICCLQQSSSGPGHQDRNASLPQNHQGISEAQACTWLICIHICGPRYHCLLETFVHATQHCTDYTVTRAKYAAGLVVSQVCDTDCTLLTVAATSASFAFETMKKVPHYMCCVVPVQVCMLAQRGVARHSYTP